MSVAARAVVRAVFVLIASIVATAVAQPAWVVDATTDAFNVSEGSTGWAYVEAFAFPAGMEQRNTGLFVVCDVEAPDGYAAFVWLGTPAIPALDPFDRTVEMLLRRDQDPVRTTRWTVLEGGSATVAFADDALRAVLFEDLALGGTLAVRLMSDPGLGSQQPTFQFQVDGFDAVQALPCAEQAAAARAAAASDPFADAPVADPFADAPAADPFADAPPADPFADAPAGEPDPVAATRGAAAADPPASKAFDDPLAHPVTGLVTFGYVLTDFEPLPPMVQPTVRTTTDDRYELLSNGDPAATYRALGGGCMADGAGLNGWIVDVASPGFDAADGTYFAWLFADGEEVGSLEVATYLVEDAVNGFLRWDAAEVGLLAAVRAYDSLDVVLVDDFEAVVDYWRIDARVVRSMFDGLPCAE